MLSAMAVGVSASVIFFVLLLSSAFSFAVEFDSPAIFNFGDSNSDTGNRIAAGIESIGLPYGQSYFNGSARRFCDGRLIVDFLSKFLLLSLLIW